MYESLSPPARLRPWILARLAIAVADLKLLELRGSSPPEKLTPGLIEYFLIQRWHEELKQKWATFQ